MDNVSVLEYKTQGLEPSGTPEYPEFNVFNTKTLCLVVCVFP